MKELVAEIVRIKKRAINEEIELRELIIELGNVLDRYDQEVSLQDEEKEYFKKLLKMKSFKKIIVCPFNVHLL